MVKRMIYLILLLGLVGTLHAAEDVTAPGDTIQGVPNDNDWPGNESPPNAIDNTTAKYLHFKGETEPSGIRVTPSAGSIVTGLTFTTANDAEPRDPVTWELSGSTTSIDGPYTLIASGDIVDFAGGTAWPRNTKGTTPIEFANSTVYMHYQLMFPTVRDAANANSMQIGEIELLGEILTAANPSPADGSIVDVTDPILEWTPSALADSHQIMMGTDYDTVANATSGAPTIGFSQQFTAGLEKGTTYYWKIFTVKDGDPASPYAGAVWSFTVADDKATQPNPADGATYQLPDLTLTWTPGIGKKYNEVYIGTDFTTVDTSETPEDTPTANSYEALGLPGGTTIYWRIDTVTAYHFDFDLLQFVIDEKTKGDVWSFTTVPEFPVVDPNLRAWLALDETSGLLALDQSGYGNHGELMGDCTWTDGRDGGGLAFDGDGDWVECGNDSSVAITGDVSVAAWIKVDVLGRDHKVASNQNNSTGGFKLTIYNADKVEFEIRTASNGAVLNRDVAGGVLLEANLWYHVAGVYSQTGEYIKTYVNGIEDRVMDTNEVLGPGGNLRLGREPFSEGNWFDGVMDDVRVYSKALTQEEVQLAMRGDPTRAFNPIPAHQSTVSIGNATQLSWTAGDIASSHDVYFSTDETAVITGDPSAFLGNQSTTTKPVATAMGNTYYWRIDEQNTDLSVTMGRVWRFVVPAYRIVDDFESYGDIQEIGVDGQKIWYVWWDGLGYTIPVVKNGNGSGSEVNLSTAIVDNGYQAISMAYNGNSWMQALTSDLPISSNWSAYGTAALNLRIRGYNASMGAFSSAGGGQFNISTGEGDIWGTSDVMHFAYVELSAVSEIIARVDSLTAPHEWAKCGVMVRNTLEGGSTHAFMAITPSNGAAFQWRPIADADSLNVNTGGGTVTAPVWLKLERNISGQASGSYSTDGSTWTPVWGPNTVEIGTPMYAGIAISANANAAGAEAVFSNVTINGTAYTSFLDTDIGVVANVGDNLYVELSDGTHSVQVPHPDNPNAILSETWQDWDIALSEFSPVNPASVQSITIGVTGAGGGSGTIFVDNIRLYPPRYVAGKLTPWAADLRDDANGRIDVRDTEVMLGNWLEEEALITTSDPGTTGLIAKYSFEGNANDVSGNGYNGTLVGGPTYTSGLVGQAIDLSGAGQYVETDANAVTLGVDSNEPKTVTAWVYTEAFNGGGIFQMGTNANGQDFSLRTMSERNFWRVQYYGGGYDHDFRADTFDKWCHIAVVYDGTTSLIYVDGALVAAADRDLNTTTTKTFSIGQWSGNYFVGLIDEVALYGRALSQAEVAYLASMGQATHVAPIRLLGNLNEDEVINFEDLAVLVDQFGETQVWP